ncbi:C-C chemokine receptor type 7, partial [Biomphalaria glabrata]
MDIHLVTQDASVVDMLTMSPSSVLVLPGVSNVSLARINSTYKRDDLENIFQYLEIITSPLVSVVGTVLNLLTVGAFLSKSLRNTSCCLYLAVRSLAVFGFLVSMFIAWTNTFASLYQRDGICQITIFLSFFCPFVSVWMVVIISLENFIRIAQPARVGRLCTPRVAKIVILIVTLVGLIVCHFPFWIIEVKNGRCDPKPHLMKTVLILNYMDTVLTMVFPVVLMIIVVPLVGLTAINAYERKKRLTSELSSRK